MISPPKHSVHKKNLKIDSYARLLLSLAEVFKGPFFVFFSPKEEEEDPAVLISISKAG